MTSRGHTHPSINMFKIQCRLSVTIHTAVKGHWWCIKGRTSTLRECIFSAGPHCLSPIKLGRSRETVSVSVSPQVPSSVCCCLDWRTCSLTPCMSTCCWPVSWLSWRLTLSLCCAPSSSTPTWFFSPLSAPCTRYTLGPWHGFNSSNKD